MNIKNLISECTAYDFKQMLEEKKPKSWLKSVSAFANGQGGSLFFGVDNDGVIRGLEDIQDVTEKISSAIKDKMDPLPEVEAIPHKDGDIKVLQLKVNAGHYTPYYYVGDGQRIAFIRVGDESMPATDEQMVALVLKGTNRTFDSLHTHQHEEDSSFTILANEFRKRTHQEWHKGLLKSFGLVTSEGVLTNAGALFADDCPLMQSRLYSTRWDGLDKDDAVNDEEYQGNILMLLRMALNFVKANTRKGWEKLPNGRKNKPEYAERAVLEALVNHFIHRDYTVMGGEVHLDIYDDRLVLSSPGGMYSGEVSDEVNWREVFSDRRNPILADVMAQLDYMEKRGSGLKRICNETKKLTGFQETLMPRFKATASHFMTTIYRVAEDEVTESVTELMTESVTELQKRVMELCKQPQSISKIAEALGVKHLSHLRTKHLRPLLDMGWIAYTIPDKPNSRLQKYQTTPEGLKVLTKQTK